MSTSTTIEELKAEVANLCIVRDMRAGLIATTRGWKRDGLKKDQEKTIEAIRTAQRQIIAIRRNEVE